MQGARQQHWQLASLSLLLLFSCALLVDALSGGSYTRAAGSYSDSYYIASFARNIATGAGWVSWHGYAPIPLDIQMSTGPVVFLPVSALLYLGLPATLAIPLATLALNLGLLWLLLRSLSGLLDGRQLFLLCLAWLPFLFSFQSHQWYLVLGETPAALLLAIATAQLMLPGRLPRHFAFAGMATAAAVFCKLVAIFGIAILSLFAAWQVLAKQVQQPGKAALACLAGLALPPAVLALLASAQFGPAVTMEYVSNYLSFYLTGHGQASTNPEEWDVASTLNNLLLNTRALQPVWEARHGFFALLALSLLAPVIALWQLPMRHAGRQRCILALALLASVFVAWFFFLGLHQQGRYFHIAGMLAALAVGLFAATSRHAATASLALALAWLSTSPQWPASSPADNYLASNLTLARAIDDDPLANEYIWSAATVVPIPFVALHTDSNRRWYSALGYVAKYADLDPARTTTRGEEEISIPQGGMVNWARHLEIMSAAGHMDIREYEKLGSELASMQKNPSLQLSLLWHGPQTVPMVVDSLYRKQVGLPCPARYSNAEFFILHCTVAQLEDALNRLVGKPGAISLSVVAPAGAVELEP
jgi:hypothetical protein